MCGIIGRIAICGLLALHEGLDELPFPLSIRLDALASSAPNRLRSFFRFRDERTMACVNSLSLDIDALCKFLDHQFLDVHWNRLVLETVKVRCWHVPPCFVCD